MSAHACFTALKAVPWFEHVGSQSNIADGGSREGCSDAWAAFEGVPLKDTLFPDCMYDLFSLGPVQQLKLWEKRLLDRKSTRRLQWKGTMGRSVGSIQV